MINAAPQPIDEWRLIYYRTLTAIRQVPSFPRSASVLEEAARFSETDGMVDQPREWKRRRDERVKHVDRYRTDLTCWQ
jgi:hypothetical protein